MAKKTLSELRSYRNLTLTKEFVLSILDYDRDAGVFRWRPRKGKGGKPAGSVAGSPNLKGYIQIKIDGRMVMAHHLVWMLEHGSFPEDQIDHRNMVKNDNRHTNLRLCTQSQNRANGVTHKNNLVGLRGVSRRPITGRWTAQIRCRGVIMHLGTFDTPEEASSAYHRAAKNLFGEFARPQPA